MKKIFAVILTLTALVSLASCSWWTTTPIEDDRLPDPIDGTGGNDTTTEPSDDTADKKRIAAAG